MGVFFFSVSKSKSVKKTRLRLIFWIHFSVFGNPDKTLSSCLIYYLKNFTFPGQWTIDNWRTCGISLTFTSSTSVQLTPSPSIPSGHSPHSNPCAVGGSLKHGTPGKHGLKRQKSWTFWKRRMQRKWSDKWDEMGFSVCMHQRYFTILSKGLE